MKSLIAIIVLASTLALIASTKTPVTTIEKSIKAQISTNQDNDLSVDAEITTDTDDVVNTRERLSLNQTKR